ncbi:MAG: hypothetical protein K2Q26_13230 [Bdellovibrionales bacterium]|nr:hypothetical protein [Bdellovibrionales bacterium]
MKKITTLFFVCFFIASCKTGKSTDSASLTFEPLSERAILVPNERSNCADLKNFEVAAMAPDASTATLQRSVKPFSATWNNMRFQWTDTRTLYIAFVQVEFLSPLLDGGKFEQFLDVEEIAALLNVEPGLTIPPGFSVETANKAGAGGLPNGIVNCGLIIGGLKPAPNANGTIRGYLRLAGTAIDPFGNEEFIREQVPLQLQVEDF